MNKIPIIFFGTSDFAVPTLEALTTSELYDIRGVVTMRDRPKGRKQTLTPPPIKVAAEKLGLTTHQPEKLIVGAGLAPALGGVMHESPKPDIFVIVAYGKIIPQTIINIPTRGAINIHPSLLPKYRGPSPIQYAIKNGDTETAVTIMLIDDQMDHGPVLTQSPRYKIQGTETYPELSNRLSHIGADLLIETIPRYLDGSIKPQEQNHTQATFTKLIKKEHGHINWNNTATDIYNQFRAFQPWPGIFTFADNKRIKITNCSVGAGLAPAQNVGTQNLSPRNNRNPVRAGLTSVQDIGTIHESPDSTLNVQCSNNTTLEILELQPEGKRPMSATDFLKGYPNIKQFDK